MSVLCGGSEGTRASMNTKNDDEKKDLARGPETGDPQTSRTASKDGGVHTPGPWHVVTGVCHNDHPDTSADVLGPNNEYIANCGCHEAAIANAHAIAALPELLAALTRAVETIHAFHDLGMGEHAAYVAWALYQQSPEMQQITTALAKAEGR